MKTEIVPKFFYSQGDQSYHRWFIKLDWSLLGAALALSFMGIIFIYSATIQSGQGNVYIFKQTVALLLGIIGMISLTALPYQLFHVYSKWIYGISILLLIAVLIFGTRLRGSRSWLNFHWFFFQPVEMTRLALAMALATYADIHHREIHHWKNMFIPLVLTGTHLGLILMQPDLSSALVLGPMMLVVLFTAGASLNTLGAFMLIGGLALGIPLASTYFRIMGSHFENLFILSWIGRSFTETGPFIQLWVGVCLIICLGWWFLKKWRVFIPGMYLIITIAVICIGVGGSFGVKKALKDYQQKRLIAFIDPAVDPLGAGYNILQSQIAIGAGQFFGKGYASGSQTQLGFLPEKRTDFIFSLIGEEIGFFGALFVLAIYFWVVWRAFDIALSARDRFGRYLAMALGTFFGFSGVVNIGMVMGLMPVTGIPLPFLSYGGSALVGSFLGIGILLSIHLRRYVLN